MQTSIALAAVAFAALLAGCGGKGKADADASPPRTVTTTRVIAHDSPLYLEEIGTCAAVATVSIQAQVAGEITERHFADGAQVKQGDVLFTIDPRPYQAALDQAKGALAQARARLDLDKLNLQRAQDLSTKKVVAPRDLDTASTNVTTDEARIESAEATVAAAQVNLDYCTIRSPIDGRAGLRQVDVGNIVSGTSVGSVLLTIQQLDPIYTDFTVAESDLTEVRRYLQTGKIKVATDLPDDDAPPRAGGLYFIDNAVQPGSGTIKLRGITPNADRHFWPGAFVRVRLILDTLKDAKLVPSQTVQISQRGPYVFVLKADGTLEQRTVQPGQRQGDFVVVLNGLNAGETVVTSGQLALAPGMRVNAQPDPVVARLPPATESIPDASPTPLADPTVRGGADSSSLPPTRTR